MSTSKREPRTDGAIDRRSMLKATAAGGVFAATWVAPRIETLGFAPAGAATPCTILSPASDDKNANSGQWDTPTAPPCPNPPTQSFGNAGQVERWTFKNPTPTCTEIVVRSITLDCDQSSKNPAYNQMGLVIESTKGSCGDCTVLEGVLLQSSQRIERKTMNNGSFNCLNGGVDASISCADPILQEVGSDARLAVRITCTFGPPGCVST